MRDGSRQDKAHNVQLEQLELVSRFSQSTSIFVVMYSQPLKPSQLQHSQSHPAIEDEDDRIIASLTAPLQPATNLSLIHI